MTHDEDRAFGTVSLDSRNQVRAIRVQCIQLRIYALGREYRFDVFGGVGFVTRRVTRIDLHQFGEVLQGLLANGVPINKVSILSTDRH